MATVDISEKNFGIIQTQAGGNQELNELFNVYIHNDKSNLLNWCIQKDLKRLVLAIYM